MDTEPQTILEKITSQYGDLKSQIVEFDYRKLAEYLASEQKKREVLEERFNNHLRLSH